MQKELLVLIVCLVSISQAYVLKETWDASNFFSKFNYFSGNDPTHGMFFSHLSLQVDLIVPQNSYFIKF